MTRQCGLVVLSVEQVSQESVTSLLVLLIVAERNQLGQGVCGQISLGSLSDIGVLVEEAGQDVDAVNLLGRVHALLQVVDHRDS